ncbi:hypothetical protein GCM10010151_73460 [Actinoallomurus spadix]|uniref:Uncharacterized protein n=1 Tax=Actinoallomurus spadix TaxID=79912 RepID=A0ABP3HK77_9ACTN
MFFRGVYSAERILLSVAADGNKVPPAVPALPEMACCVVSKDDGPRAGTSLEKVSQLQSVFRPDGTAAVPEPAVTPDWAMPCRARSTPRSARHLTCRSQAVLRSVSRP